MGRPSLAAERRAQILDAFARCLAARGLEGTTLEVLAAEAGVQRAAIRHYIGNRDDVIRAGVDHIAARYERSIEGELGSVSRSDRLDGVLDSLFLGRFASGHARDDRALDALLAAAASDTSARAVLRSMYARFVERLAGEIAASRPAAAPAAVADAAYAIVCLVEHNNTMRSLGFPRDRARAARAAAAALVDRLGGVSP